MGKKSDRLKKRVNILSASAAALILLGVALNRIAEILESDEVNAACEVKSGTSLTKVIPQLRSLGFSTRDEKGNGLQLFDANDRVIANWVGEGFSGLTEGTLVASKVLVADSVRRSCRIRFREGSVLETRFQKSPLVWWWK